MKPVYSILAVLIILLLVPLYNIYWKTLQGKAELARQQYAAQAEVTRATGVAESNRIIGESLAGKENYLKYLWIQALTTDRNKTLIYVPTEANIPIMEATRLQAN